MNRYTVFCICGKSHDVSATLAGSAFTCSCGGPVEVPKLSSLRESAGESAIPANTIETIRSMIRNEELPEGSVCPYSGRPANETIFLHVQCERIWTRGRDSTDTGHVFLAFIILGWIGALIATIRPQRRRVLGRETFIDIPIRISSDVRARLLRMRRQKKLKAMLHQTPIYSQLLHEYPNATITPIKSH